jgi:hypothetical protein
VPGVIKKMSTHFEPTWYFFILENDHWYKLGYVVEDNVKLNARMSKVLVLFTRINP